MKILGKTGNRVLVEVSPDELEEMTGLDGFSFGTMSVAGRCGHINVIGKEYRLTDIYQRVHLLNINDAELAKVRKMLRSIADVLEPLNVEIPRPEKAEVGDE